MTDEERAQALHQIKLARGVLERNPHDPGLTMRFVKYLPATKEADLDELAWLYGSEAYGSTQHHEVVELLDNLEMFCNKEQNNEKAV